MKDPTVTGVLPGDKTGASVIVIFCFVYVLGAWFYDDDNC